MKTFLRDNWIPVAISLCALLVATSIGLVPVLRSESEGSSSTQNALEQRIATLEAKVKDLETASGATDVGTAIEVSPALRAEIDQIVRGLVNQTGRISRLKKELEPVLAWGGSPPVPKRIDQQIRLIDKALLKQTGRIKSLQKAVEPVAGNSDSIDRLALQVKNLESAVTQLHKRLVKITSEQRRTAASKRPSEPDTLQSIEAKLGEILDRLGPD